MRYEITEENNIILSGLQLLRRQFDSLSEYVVFSVIQTMTQARRGQYDGNMQFIADWSMLSERQAQRIIHNLIKKGYVKAECRAGDTTILRAVSLSKNELLPPTNCHPRQIVTPDTSVTPPPTNCHPPSKIIIESISSSSSLEGAHTHEGIEKLKDWIKSADFDFWIYKQFERYKTTEDANILIQTFYEDDFTVREDIEKDQRREVLKHFQNWLPKYLKSKNDNNNEQSTKHDTRSQLERTMQEVAIGMALASQTRQ